MSEIDIVERLIDLHRKILAAPRVQTENGPGAKVVLTYLKAAAIDESADLIAAYRAALSAVQAERDRVRKALAHAEKIVAAAARQKETDHIGDEWFTELATAALIWLPAIRDALSDTEVKP